MILLESERVMQFVRHLKSTSIGTRSAFFSMKAAELKCQNLIVKKVCQVEHFKAFCKAIGPELGL